MTLKEAIKSGKRFRRKGQTLWRSILPSKTEAVLLCVEDAIAEDWEIEEKKIELSWSQVEKVLLSNAGAYTFDCIKHELGFKE